MKLRDWLYGVLAEYDGERDTHDRRRTFGERVVNRVALTDRIVAEVDRRNPAAPPEPAGKLSELIHRAVADRLRFISANRERLIEAWVAETGLLPHESELVETRSADGLSLSVLIRPRAATPGPAPTPRRAGTPRGDE